MDRSGLISILLLALVAIIVLLSVARTNQGVAGLWERVAGQSADTTATVAPVTAPRPLSPGDGQRTVDQMQRDMEAMQELSRSLGR